MLDIGLIEFVLQAEQYCSEMIEPKKRRKVPRTWLFNTGDKIRNGISSSANEGDLVDDQVFLRF